jgi:hypothetical protein
MDSFRDSRAVQRVAATLGVVGTIALGFFYVLVPALTVPKPAMYAFDAAWLVLVVLSLYWWSPHPWRALAVPVAGLVAVLAVLWLGGEYLGWTA